MEQYYLGFDAGTQSVKTAVYDMPEILKKIKDRLKK